MRRVVVIAYDFPPIASAAAQRTRQLVRHLPSHGWQPVVVTPRAGTSWAHDPATDDLPARVGVRRTASIEPRRVAASMGIGGGAAGHQGATPPLLRAIREWVAVPDDRVGWVPFAVAAALRCSRSADAILTENPPASAHVAGLLVSRLTGRPWVADFHDPWALASYHAWRSRWRPAVESRLERAVLARADRLVATTAWLARYLSERGGADRVRVVTNGFEPTEFEAPVVSEAAPPEEAFTVLHAGSFYGPRSPEPLLAGAAAAMEAEPGLRSTLRLRLRDWQDSENAARLDAAVRRFGLADVVERIPEVPRREALAAMRSASVLAVVTDPLEGGRGLIPIKLFEYLGARRPILALAPPEGETGRLARAAGGLVADPGDVPGTAAAIGELHRRWRTGNGWQPNEVVVRAHHWDRLAARMAAVLDEAAGGRG